MKANQQALRNEDDAQVGIGTMIVFIATILVAAVAAGVLINVSGGLQSKAVATGSDATENVVTNMNILAVYGVDGSGSGDGSLETVNMRIQLGAGSEPVDLAEVVIEYLDGAALSNPAGTPTEINGDTDTILEAGELWELTFTAPTPITESQSISIDLIPQSGNPAQVAFTSPSAFGSDVVIQLA